MKQFIQNYMPPLCRITLLQTLLIALVLGGCISTFQGRDTPDKKVDQRDGKKMSFVFGYIDTGDAESDVEWAQLKQLEPRVFDPDKPARAHEDVFYVENLLTGKYRLESFGGNTLSFFHRGYFIATHSIDYQMNIDDPVLITIKKPGVHFMGSYKFFEVERGFFEKDQFTLKKIAKPTEKEVLARIVQFSRGTRWEPILRKRLQRLK